MDAFFESEVVYNVKGIQKSECLLHLEEERLRDEPRRGTVVVVGVRDIVRVELGLVVEVEVRSVIELTIAVIGYLP